MSINCPLCKSEKPTYEHLLIHMATRHYKEEISQYADRTERKCQMCEKDFRTYNHLVILNDS